MEIACICKENSLQSFSCIWKLRKKSDFFDFWRALGYTWNRKFYIQWNSDGKV